MIDTILLITKQYIYAKKCLQEDISFIDLAHHINVYRELEKQYCYSIKKSTVHHSRKWHLYDLI